MPHSLKVSHVIMNFTEGIIRLVFFSSLTPLHGGSYRAGEESGLARGRV